MSNDRGLTAGQILEAHKGQPTIEKHFEQVKTVHEIAPVYLKNEGRIEALFTLYFLALLVQALDFVQEPLFADHEEAKRIARCPSSPH